MVGNMYMLIETPFSFFGDLVPSSGIQLVDTLLIWYLVIVIITVLADILLLPFILLIKGRK